MNDHIHENLGALQSLSQGLALRLVQPYCYPVSLNLPAAEVNIQ